MAIRPDLVQLRNLSSSDTVNTAVLGESPQLGSAAEGFELFNQALVSWKLWLNTADRESLVNHYRTVFDSYESYVETYYKGSWEDAIQAWWQVKSASKN